MQLTHFVTKASCVDTAKVNLQLSIIERGQCMMSFTLHLHLAIWGGQRLHPQPQPLPV